MAPWSMAWMQYSLSELDVNKEVGLAAKMAAASVARLPEWSGEDWRFHLYTDGSASKKRSGYSVIVLLQIGATLALIGNAW